MDRLPAELLVLIVKCLRSPPRGASRRLLRACWRARTSLKLKWPKSVSVLRTAADEERLCEEIGRYADYLGRFSVGESIVELDLWCVSVDGAPERPTVSRPYQSATVLEALRRLLLCFGAVRELMIPVPELFALEGAHFHGLRRLFVSGGRRAPLAVAAASASVSALTALRTFEVALFQDESTTDLEETLALLPSLSTLESIF